MNEYVHTYRLTPLWAALLLTIPVGLGAWGVASASYYDTVAGTPLFSVLTYGLAAAYVNRAWVRVDEHGISHGYGPLPVGRHAEWVPPEEVARIYLRWAYLLNAEGRVVFLAAGVETKDGRRIDLTEPLQDARVVRRAAGEIAAALGWAEELEAIQGEAVAFQKQEALPQPLWRWLVLGTTAWGALVELYLLF